MDHTRIILDSAQNLVTLYLSVVFCKKSGQPKVLCADTSVYAHATTPVHFPPSNISGRLVDLLTPSVTGAYHVKPCVQSGPYQP